MEEKTTDSAQITALSQRFERIASILKRLVEEHKKGLTGLKEMQRICEAASQVSKGPRIFPERKRVKTVKDLESLPSLQAGIIASFQREGQLCQDLEFVFADLAPQNAVKGRDIGMEVT